jgi:hypothetical protein
VRHRDEISQEVRGGIEPTLSLPAIHPTLPPMGRG